MHRFKRKPSPGMVIALLALVVAGGGTATAKSLISSRDVRDGSLSGRDIKDHTITAHDLSRSLTVRRSAIKGEKGDRGDNGAAGTDGAPGSNALFVDEDTKPAFPQQVVCRIVANPPSNPDQDDTGRAQVLFNEQHTLSMSRLITIVPGEDPTVELNCWQPKRTGKGDGIVITGARVNLLRVNKTVDLNPDDTPPPAEIPDPGPATKDIQELHFNNTDERILIHGRFQDTNDAEASGVPNPAKDDLATNIVSFQLTPPAGTTTDTKYLVWARVRTDKVRRSTDKDATGQPTKQAPHVQADENAEPLQSQTLLP
jgi:hypothetical protein